MPRGQLRGLIAAGVALAAASCNDQAPPLMWEVGGEHGSTVYLLGTIHIGVCAREDLPDPVWERFDRTQRVLVEAEIRTVDKQEYLELASLPAGESLDQLLPPAVWSDLLQLVDTFSPATLRQLRPWAVIMEVFRALPFPQCEGMDLTLLNAADEAKKAIEPLEPWQDQAAALNQVPLEQGVQGLIALVQNLEAVQGKYLELIDLYKQGDLDGVLRIAPEAGAVPTPDDPSFDPFIRQRTLRWLPKIEAHLTGSDGETFVGVGFGHVIGPEGLVELLEGGGYSIGRVVE